MEKASIQDYKRYYREQMMEYDWNYCTAFQLKGEITNSHGRKVKIALPIQECREFIHYNVLSAIKKRLIVRDENRRLKRGIPFYSYHIICKAEDDTCYHAHMIMRIQERYANNVNSYIQILTGNKIEKLETDEDVIKMINYMLKKGNCVINSDDPRLIPTGYNLGMNTDVFDS